jgi:3'-phosphoadenosine 5'-phosphosulfate sulfotransferase (PAPS reductase)/FAD synthetase
MIRYLLRASYGNDSVALIQWAHERKLKDVSVLFSDTGWAAPWWEPRVAQMEFWADLLGFDTVRIPSVGLEQLVRNRKGWPRQGIQFCTTELKILPALKWMDEHDPFGLATVVVGIRREESANRRSFPEYVESSPDNDGRAMWAPLVDYSEADRNALLARAGVEPLPHRSMECFPCINSNRADLRELAKHPQRIAEIEAIERSLGSTSKGKPRTMFRPYRYMGATGIREIVRWAESAPGEFDPDDGTGGGNCDSGMCGT